jgi:tetratricopeptide (TPR) repeat protein
MKAFVLFTASMVGISVPASAQAAVLTLGGPLSTLCYQSALGADSRPSALDGCTRALNEEGLATPDRAATYVNRGIVLMSGGRLKEADADFDSALKLNHGLPDGWLNKGFLRLRVGNGRDALPLIQKGIDAGASNKALAIFARGVAHEQMGEFSAAYADLKNAQRLAPGWSMPTEYLANYRVIQH